MSLPLPASIVSSPAPPVITLSPLLPANIRNPLAGAIRVHDVDETIAAESPDGTIVVDEVISVADDDGELVAIEEDVAVIEPDEG